MPARRPRQPAKPTFSPTKLALYLRCPLAYRLAYIHGLRGRFGRARPETSLGASLHRALEFYHREGGAEALTADDLVNRLRAAWTSAGYGTEDQEREHLLLAEQMAQAFHASQVEAEGVAILTEKVLKVDRGRYVLMGRLDRVDRLPDGTLEVVDYKSGRSSLSAEEVGADLGLMVYETLVRCHFPETPVRVAIHALRPNLRVSVARSDEEAAAVGRWLDDLAHGILDDETHEARVLDSCEDCDFRRICPALKRTSEAF